MENLKDMVNQNPEQLARDRIDQLLRSSGWTVQNNKQIDFSAGLGQAVREYQTDVGPADYVLFVDKKAVGVIEAKREDIGHKITDVENQTEGYANATLKWANNKEPLPFLFETTGVITRFTDSRDPKPRSREIFSFYRPETLKEWLENNNSLRHRLTEIPPLNPDKLPAKELGLRDCQETAIVNLEESFKHNRPRALIQMATGAGKTYTAITAMYRILKHAKGKRILFLVDTKNLGEQAEQEMLNFTPSDDARKFTELYAVQRLKSGSVPKDAQVCISTIQRMYSILKGAELEVHYVTLLRELAINKGMLGQIFTKAQNKIQDPAKLSRLIEMVNDTNWVMMGADTKGTIYEGLLEKNAEDTKSGAGQYFTPRSLIQTMVECMRPEPSQTIADPACGTGGFFLSAYDYLVKHYQMDKTQKAHLKHETFSGNEIVANTRRLCLPLVFNEYVFTQYWRD